MKLKKIAAVCKGSGTAVLWDATDREGVVHQWICSGGAAYPVEGLPYLTQEHMVTVLDLSEKQQEKMKIEHTPAPDIFDFSDTADGEAMAKEAAFTVVYGGTAFLPVSCEQRTQFLDWERLAPITAEYKDLQFWRRGSENGLKYYAVKAGLLCVGIVAPSYGLEELKERILRTVGDYRE